MLGAASGIGRACAKVQQSLPSSIVIDDLLDSNLTISPSISLSTHTQAFYEAGCRHLVLVDRDNDRLQETIKMYNMDEKKVSVHVLDVRDDEAVERLVGGIPEKWGSLDYAL